MELIRAVTADSLSQITAGEEKDENEYGGKALLSGLTTRNKIIYYTIQNLRKESHGPFESSTKDPIASL